jgi:predicted nucleic acid-binding protein
MVFDTDVLIDCFRGVPAALRLVENDPAPAISIVTVMELARGARAKAEMKSIHRFLADVQFEILPLSELIGQLALRWIEEHGWSDGLGIPDALIAATAWHSRRVLASGNARHFRVIASLDLKVYRRPAAN